MTPRKLTERVYVYVIYNPLSGRHLLHQVARVAVPSSQHDIISVLDLRGALWGEKRTRLDDDR